MIIARAPLRITLGGGGTDLPGYYQKFGGFMISAAIDKYIYITGSRRDFDKKFWLSYSRLEVCESVSHIQHEILKACLTKFKFDSGIEIHSISEVPGNSGLGSSGSFSVCMLALLNALKKKKIGPEELAEKASHLEMVELKKSCGKQDQVIAAYGGIICLNIDKAGRTKVTPLKISAGTIKRLQENLLIYHTGVSRKSELILKQQNARLHNNHAVAVSNLSKIKDIAYESQKCLQSGNLDDFGRLLHEHWILKRAMQQNMANPALNEIYDEAFRAGMLGGKIMGAGGGGFFMFYVPPASLANFREKMGRKGLKELDWKFSMSGCEIIFRNE